ncbi:16S rRNA (cytosine(1402)-N(4))-methyltransferase RsmH [Ramlibacter sp.]|uniref:16S rRNA (cytosine(1402)-N(4))-methyltransferase RsmH n=1 Tax=Ramlibacter sp. TaxID=1917967 RepID=UPI003D10CB53
MDGTWQHTTVLLNEAVAALRIKPDATYVDATFGRGGHSRLLLEKLGPLGRLIAFDKDPDAIAEAGRIDDPRFSIRHEGFSAIGELPPASVAGVLMDLGVSSPQIDNPARGFSFRNDGPLDMRMDPTRGESAAQWLATAPVAQMAEVIRDYGEERFALPIAKAIDARRQERGALATTRELAELVARAVKTREPGQDPATRTFQALRIFVNAELEELQQALEASVRILEPAGRLVTISFHSLEDRIVKQFVVKHSREVFDRRAPFAPPKPMKLKALDRVRPTPAEVAGNPRSRSAIMRVAERTEA